MNSFLRLCIIGFFLILTIPQCKKKVHKPELPPETTIGAMTFGCKINGKVFVPRDGSGKPGLYVQYVNYNIGPGAIGGWYLNIPATDWKSRPIKGVSITTDSLLVHEGGIYEFKMSKGNAQAEYYMQIEYHKMDSDNGELHITKFDKQKRILSGTFFFTGTNISTGEKVSVTDGRFDIRY